MKFIGDFHVHSHFSLATSKELAPEYLDYWAKIKGIKVLGTGDFTHPGWLKELKEKLEPAEEGLYKLKDKYKLNPRFQSISADKEVRFLLTAEISTIYKKDNKIRKVHNIIFAPDFGIVEKIQQKLSRIGNITSDGRPILGFDSKNLLELALNVSEDILFVPAHIWTPWFSALGDKSGFDSIEECYCDLSKHIYAVETGLSTDAPMNWMCSFLDKYTLISNSDAHSPEKLGRNANILNTNLSYKDIVNAIKTGNPKHFLGTIDLFPQEGKYHYAGHRKCGICWDPLETLKNKGICPVCGKKVTLGVMDRIVQLSDRKNLSERKNQIPYYSIIPLKEILSEINEVGPKSQKITGIYNDLIHKAGPELDFLLNLPLDNIKKLCNSIITEGIKRMRNKEIHIKEGFDGEYGKIKVFSKNEAKHFSQEESLFKGLTPQNKIQPEKREIINFDLKEYQSLKKMQAQENDTTSGELILNSPVLNNLNFQQRKAVDHSKGPVLILAGPGTGKTKTLTHRIANLIQNKSVKPENILALTFTNKAANEIKERIKILLNNEDILPGLQVFTFHGLGLSVLKRNYKEIDRNKNFSIIDEADKKLLLQKNLKFPKNQIKDISAAITSIKNDSESLSETKGFDLTEVFEKYNNFLKEHNLLDFDDLLYYPAKLLNNNPELLQYYRQRYQWILIDEYQDINFSQYKLIKLLMPDKNANICAIGDPNQSIYGFRGADIKFIKEFITDYPQADVYKLLKSYRCSDYILKASNTIINSQEKDVLQGLQKGIKIKIIKNSSDKSEAEFVARTIENMIGGLGFFSIDSNITDGNHHLEIESLTDFAVLCRIKSQIKTLEKSFNDHNIPYQTAGESSLLQHKGVKAIIDLLSFSINPENTFIKYKLEQNKILSALDFNKIRAITKTKSVKDKVTTIIDNCMQEVTPEDRIQFKNLIDLTDNFGSSLDRFLEFIILNNETDTYKENTEKVNIMTLHAAKGLEFNCVFIVGCEKGLIPYSLYEKQESNPEEEKRLLYVGMTRAKKFLFLSHAKRRVILGREYNLERSPYLDSIENRLIELTKTEHNKKPKKEDTQLSLF